MRNYTIESTLCELSVVMNNVATVDTVDTYSEANHSGRSGFVQEYVSAVSTMKISSEFRNCLYEFIQRRDTYGDWICSGGKRRI
jgi:hypothetical protein